MQTTTLEPHSNCWVQKTSKKNPNIWKMTTFPKWPKLASMHKLQPLQKRHFGSKIKNVKNMRKTTLEAHLSCCVQKTAPRNL